MEKITIMTGITIMMRTSIMRRNMVESMEVKIYRNIENKGLIIPEERAEVFPQEIIIAEILTIL